MQYANARVNSILKNADEQNPDYTKRIQDKSYDLKLLDNVEDIKLIKLMASWPRIVELSCVHQEPHRIAFYLIDLASEFHSLWSKGNENASLIFLLNNDFEKTLARLALAKAVSTVISSGLSKTSNLVSIKISNSSMLKESRAPASNKLSLELI